jgi:hypothetical protein
MEKATHDLKEKEYSADEEGKGRELRYECVLQCDKHCVRKRNKRHWKKNIRFWVEYLWDFSNY